MPQLSLPILLRQQKHKAADTSNQSTAAARHSSSIERLPAELRLQIIENLPAGDLRSIYNLAFAGPTFYHLISEHEASLAENVVVSAVGEDAMPIAAALYELEELGDKLPRTRSSTNYSPDEESWDRMFLILGRHSHSHKWHTESRITKFSVAASYLKLDVVVGYWARKLANRALKWAYSVVPRQKWRDDPESKPGPNPKPTAAEMSRFRKALYKYQLLSVALPWNPPDIMEPIMTSYYCVLRRYKLYMSPWEYEQVRQVELLLAGDQIDHCCLPYPAEHYSELYSFIFKQGLVRLRVLDALRPWPVRRAMLRRKWVLNQGQSAVRVPVLAGNFTPLDVEWDEDGNTTLHSSTAFEEYSEEDDGPKVWWYYDFLKGFPAIRMKDDYDLTPACRYCSFALGYLFWDFERLRKMARGKCPSIGDLVESTRGIPVTLDEYVHALDDRVVILPTSKSCRLHVREAVSHR
ncbi:hypothetical protein F4680DRAFT_452723 [Xylaria scruposa]|nr:hypothetical protein F4680DRAFT_452723 [Xylaria scruposa]